MSASLDIKLILLGEAGVGKTSIIKRYIDDEFDINELSSISMNFVSKKIDKEKFSINLNIWDTVGQEKLRSLSNIFLNNTKIVILVYSINNRKSYDSLDYWLNLYKDKLEADTILGVAGNKKDLYLQQKVSEDDGKKYADKHGAIFGLLSAKEDKLGIDDFMNKLVDLYLSKNKNIKKTPNKYIALNQPIGDGQGGGCCQGKGKKSKSKYDSIIKGKNGIIHSVFLGEKGVGKTSIMKRICEKKFDPKEPHTVQIGQNSIFSEETKIKVVFYDVNNDKIKSREYVEIIKKSHIFFLVYNVNDKKTLEKLRYWINVIKNCKEIDEKYILYILGNKDDNKAKEGKKNDDKFSSGQKFSSEFKASFRTISAKGDKGLENLVGEALDNYVNLV